MEFAKEKTLLGFIDNLIIPFFYNYLYHQKKGTLVFGELAHGIKGIFEFYKTFFQVTNEDMVLKLLRIAAMHDYQGYAQCPCNSGKKLKYCHGKKLLKCMFLQTDQEVMEEYLTMRVFLSNLPV